MLSKGINNIDKIYFINLKHRTDRLEHITKELNKMNVDTNKITKIEGIYKENFGILGCGMSHKKALEEFLKTDDSVQTCLILEDDFCFTQSIDVVNDLFNNFFKEVKNFDVLMLASNTLKEVLTEWWFLTRIVECQTASGYLVHKKFAPILLRNFSESVERQQLKGFKVHALCHDIFWKAIQPVSKWYCLKPKIGKQIASYSDIEKKKTDYNC
jgi:GR25 family glycosyltransferase involved in LPS biosynthesis